jgi:ApbE superfamily uncharacterized protein (UPF0280 family)
MFNKFHATQIEKIVKNLNISYHDFIVNIPTFESLKNPITTEEVREAISRMSRPC